MIATLLVTDRPDAIMGPQSSLEKRKLIKPIPNVIIRQPLSRGQTSRLIFPFPSILSEGLISGSWIVSQWRRDCTIYRQRRGVQNLGAPQGIPETIAV